MEPVKLKLLPNSQVRVFYADGTQEVRKARGKLFKPYHIQPIREGRKTQTRRFTAYDQPGDLIWIREVCWEYGQWHCEGTQWISMHGYCYENPQSTIFWRKRFPLFMPREAARLWLLCTGRREERLQAISEADAKAEGAKKVLWHIIDGINDEHLGGSLVDHHICYRNGFANLWDSINTKPGTTWKDNSVIKVITFRLFFEGRAEHEKEIK